MRTLVIGDIHGGLKALVQVLERVKISEADKLVFVGDYVDGWSESAQLIDYLIKLSDKNECVFIKGNHDLWCENWLLDGFINDTWYIHGGKETISSYYTFDDKQKQTHLDFFKAMPLYHIDDKNRLFIHAGFTSMHGVEKEMNMDTFMVDRTLWETALTMDKRIQKDSMLYPNRLKHYKEIYIGHTPTLRYHKYEPMNAVNVWNVDTGAAFTGKLSILDADSKQVFQSDALTHLYPNELGRNK